MIGKSYTDVIVFIDSQYEFLNYLIQDVAKRYCSNYQRFSEQAENESGVVSEGDYEIYCSTIHSYDELLDKDYNYVIESRKIIFVSIISYLEMGLYRIIDYYKIERKKGKTDIKDLITAIKENHKKELNLPNEIMISDFYRLLRNHYVHSRIEREKNRKMLDEYVASCSMINVNKDIIDDTFLEKALKNVHAFLMTIETAYESKE